MNRFRLVCCLPVIIALAGFVALTPHSQAEKRGKKDRQHGFAGVIKKDQRRDIEHLRELLASIDEVCPKIPQKCVITDELYDEVFGDINDHNLPIIFVYLDEDLDVRAHRLIWRRNATAFVYGLQQLWVVLFSERNVTLEAELTQLYDGQTGIGANLRNVFISSGRRTTEDRQARALSKGIELRPWNAEPTGEGDLWVGEESFFINVDAGYNLSVLPADEATRHQVDFERIDIRFTNSRRKSVDFGIGIGYTGDISDEDVENADDVSGIRTENGVLSLYWMLQTYIRRPTLLDPIGRRFGSRYRVSYAVTFGFNLDVFNVDQIIAGLNIGHLFGRNGVVVGVNVLGALGDQEAKVRPFFGVNFNF